MIFGKRIARVANGRIKSNMIESFIFSSTFDNTLFHDLRLSIYINNSFIEFASSLANSSNIRLYGIQAGLKTPPRLYQLYGAILVFDGSLLSRNCLYASSILSS